MIYIDSTIMQKGKPATAGAKILENFISPIGADLLASLGQPIEQVTLTEFGLGKPMDKLPTPLLCSDIFGYVRKAADGEGLCSLRPKYGSVSSYGLIPIAASLDNVIIITKKTNEAFDLRGKICKVTPFTLNTKVKRVAPPETPYDEIQNQILEILAFGELTGNLSRYDGIKFGRRAAEYNGLEELYTKTRTEGFSEDTKAALIAGCAVLSKDYYANYFDKALKLRKAIKDLIKPAENEYFEVPLENNFAVLCGLPSITLNGVQLVAGSVEALQEAVNL